MARMACVGALALAGLLCACSTARPRAAAENKTAAPGPVAPAAAAQSDFAIDPIDIAQYTEAPAKDADAAHPWLTLKSIGFFYNRSDLTAWEATKIAEIVDYMTLHPEAEVGINRPAVAPGGDPGIDDLNHRRVRTIINGLITAGVSENRIHVGNYVDLPLSLEQQVVVLTRRAL